jgi:hypothetical protein
VNNKVKVLLQYVIGLPLLWLMILGGGFIAANPPIFLSILVVLGVTGLILRKRTEIKKKKKRRDS